MCRMLSLHVVDDVDPRGVPGQVHQCSVHFYPLDWIHLVYCLLCCSGLKNMYYKVCDYFAIVLYVSCDITQVMII